MRSVFRKDDNHVDKPNRNPYNKTFVKNLSARFGELIPVFCQPVMNGESVSIKHKHNFNFMPIVFPVQTRVRASIQYFYVRNRNVWKDWEDFQFKMKPNLVPPYLKFNKQMQREMLNVGGFLDNIGCPVTVSEDIGRALKVQPLPFDPSTKDKWYNPYTNTFVEGWLDFSSLEDPDGTGDRAFYKEFSEVQLSTSNADYLAFRKFRYPIKAYSDRSNYAKSLKIRGLGDDASGLFVHYLVRGVRGTNEAQYVETTRVEQELQENSRGSRRSSSSSSAASRNSTIGSVDTTRRSEQVVSSDSLGVESAYFIVSVNIGFSSIFEFENYQGWQFEEIIGYYAPAGMVDGSDINNEDLIPIALALPQDYAHLGGIHLTDVPLAELPYANIVQDTDNHIRVSAFPNRHFESVYNSFYRNAENNPYKINGVVEYNKFIDNVDGGAQTYVFPRRYANWQDDAFTTALHTPQHGTAPLVGLVNQGETPYRVTFANDDGTSSTVHLTYNQENESIQVVQNSSDLDRDGYVGQLEDALIEAVKFGITINDFRNVNSFQRWLENNVRKGYKYRDQIKAHYGVSVAYDVLDMPEYLGGTSRDMNVTQVTQTTENENGVLGDYAGQAWIEGESEHEIDKYCDEDGYIIGILHIMPVASYSQIIPKHLLRDSAFDWFSPEFGKIGMQPILNREIAPIASFYRGNGSEVFGYNRPWYDLLDCVDTVHGKFRTQFRNFIINRVFDGVPTLSEDFLVYNPDQVNNIFYVDDNEDKILGQILFDYKVRIPVPLHGIAALE